MPRRVATPEPTQDDIEVDEQAQDPSQQDSVQDADQQMDSAEEEAPPQKSSKRTNASKKSKSKPGKVKTEKSTASRARRDAQGSDNESEDVPFDRDEFLATARPLSKKGVDSIAALSRDWVEVRHQVRHVGFNLVTETTVAVEEVSGNTEKGEETISQLDAVMRKLIDAEYEFTVQEKSLLDLKARAASGETIPKLEDAYSSHVQDALEAYSHLTSRRKYGKNDDYFKFRERVWEVNHEDAMPPMGDLIPQEADDSDAESDIEVGGMTQDYKCPLTLTHLDNPLTSKTCNHSFSADAITEYLRAARGRKACPASGCSEILTLADLVPNKELAKRAADAARRAKRREEDESDDSEAEVVD